MELRWKYTEGKFMMEIKSKKLFKFIILILISSLLGIAYHKLSSLQFLIGNIDIRPKDEITAKLIKDIKIVKFIVLLISSLSIAVYSNLIYFTNKVNSNCDDK